MKISKVKRSNQKRTKLAKQGKLKARRHRDKPKKQFQKAPQTRINNVQEEEEGSEDDRNMLEMVEKDDLSFLKEAISNKSYELLKKIRCTDNSKQTKKAKKTEENLEYRYEKTAFKGVEEDMGKEFKFLLPIKTKDGFVKTRAIEKDDVEDEETAEGDEEDMEVNEDEKSDNESLDFELKEDTKELDETELVSTAKLLACREEVLKSRRYTIGILSSSILEDPQLRSKNFTLLLDFMEEKNPEVYITVRKLATASLLEIFKDILPSYHITQVNQEGVKFKKDTFQLQNFEADLLKNYKNYLQKLEKMAKLLYRKGNSMRKLNDREIQLATLAVNCMCDLLITHPYFNFSNNIAKFLIPLLDNKLSSTREIVMKCFTQIFKEDKRGEITLMIVQQLNKYIKPRGHTVHHEVISVLLGLRIKDINLDKEKEEELKKQKLMSHKQRILSLSKRERKKSKKLEQVEQELLETKAEENKKTVEKVFTDITSLVFTIYFRILKEAPSSKILSACLEGLAKFAHCINLEFYQDIVNVLSALLDEGNLALRERLNCIQTVFIILSGQGSALNIDPHRFYSHLYKNLLSINAGKTCTEIDVALKVLVIALVHRQKNISQNRLTAFVKRIATMALGLQHNGALGVLGVIKMIMQLGKAAYILLDTDSGCGDGLYLPELDDPEYCNAKSTSLWEIVALQRHYHNTVHQVAKNIAWEVPASGEGSLSPDIAKLNPEELCKEYDPSTVAFKPAVAVPKKVSPKTLIKHEYASLKFETYVNECFDKTSMTDNENFDICSALRKRKIAKSEKQTKLSKKKRK